MNRINLVCLGVRDIKKSLAFYKNIGFATRESAEAPPVVFFNNQGSKLELYPLSELAKDINRDNPPPPAPPGAVAITLACNVKTKDEVDALIALAVQHGGVIAKAPQTVFWGGYSGYFQDPDGYYWEVAYFDQWQFGTDDMLIIR